MGSCLSALARKNSGARKYPGSYPDIAHHVYTVASKTPALWSCISHILRMYHHSTVTMTHSLSSKQWSPGHAIAQQHNERQAGQGCFQRNKALIKPAHIPLSAAGTLYSTGLILNHGNTSSFQRSVSNPEDVIIPSSGCRRLESLPAGSENQFQCHELLCFYFHFNHFTTVDE